MVLAWSPATGTLVPDLLSLTCVPRRVLAAWVGSGDGCTGCSVMQVADAGKNERALGGSVSHWAHGRHCARPFTYPGT
ncbi:hypothetical protein F5Y09DRAFT_294018, partial [Xylaria sp. FL1042]